MRVVIANFDDWKGIYVDGELKFENHNINFRDFLQTLKIDAEIIEVDMEELDWGRYPETEEELRKAIEDG